MGKMKYKVIKSETQYNEYSSQQPQSNMYSLERRLSRHSILYIACISENIFL